MSRSIKLVMVLLILIAVGFFVATQLKRPSLPFGFSDGLVVKIGSPTGIAFTPDGRMLVSTQQGVLRVVRDDVLLPEPAIDLSARTCPESERGLVGITVDPLFTSNRFVYLYYTFKKHGTCTMNKPTDPVNRLSRFVMTGNALSGETILLDNIPSPAGYHNAGGLAFGKDGFLYVGVGDGGCDWTRVGGCGAANDTARDRNVLSGKILRITRDGAIPPDNPFTGPGTVHCATGAGPRNTICRETFAWGLRNPFRTAFDPNAPDTRFYINDVGQNTWEEIDVGAKGADYGWNVREGPCANDVSGTSSTTNCGPSPYTDPIFAYRRTEGCGAITGGAFVPDGLWPAPYSGAYLFSDYLCGKIFRLAPNGSGGFRRVEFEGGLTGLSAVHLSFGPWGSSQALYYTTFADGGAVRRISFAASGAR
jgi:glucose/arabinose dehydrogenase